jgi:hypothetical protein
MGPSSSSRRARPVVGGVACALLRTHVKEEARKREGGRCDEAGVS